MRAVTKCKHLAFGLIVLVTVMVLDWLTDASDYPQG